MGDVGAYGCGSEYRFGLQWGGPEVYCNGDATDQPGLTALTPSLPLANTNGEKNNAVR